MESDKKTLTEKQKEEIATLQGKIDGYESTLNDLYEAVRKVLEEKEKAEKELKELKEKNKTETEAKENEETEILQLLSETNKKTEKLDAKILDIQNLIKK